MYPKAVIFRTIWHSIFFNSFRFIYHVVYAGQKNYLLLLPLPTPDYCCRWKFEPDDTRKLHLFT